MTKREAVELTRTYDRLRSLGIPYEDADKLRRISLTLRRWFEQECGTNNGCIERDDNGSGKPYWLSAYSGSRFPVADREKGARRRLAAIMAKYPTLTAYVQGDPRGSSLYILTAGQIAGQSIDSIYNRGIAL